jgi:uncharacterized protein (DUF983 family)
VQKKKKTNDPALGIAKAPKVTGGGPGRMEIPGIATKAHRCRRCGEEYEKKFNDDGYCSVCLG